MYVFICIFICVFFLHYYLHSAYGALVVDWCIDFHYNPFEQFQHWMRFEGVSDHPDPNPTSIDFQPLLEKNGISAFRYCTHIHSFRVCAFTSHKIHLYVARGPWFWKTIGWSGRLHEVDQGLLCVFSSRFLDNWHYIVMKSSLGKTMDRRKASHGTWIDLAIWGPVALVEYCPMYIDLDNYFGVSVLYFRDIHTCI